ncbi:MAG: IS200/IS605 family transposase [Bacteroidota bacterium]
MSRFYVRIIVHTVFSTKSRRAFIDPFIEDKLFAKIRMIAQDLGVEILRINGGFDHVHIVNSMPRTKSIAEIVKKIKEKSSRWVKGYGDDYSLFQWQEGYGAFSCDYKDLDDLFRYVDQQKRHHYGINYTEEVRMTFGEEYTKILRRYGFEIDWSDDD